MLQIRVAEKRDASEIMAVRLSVRENTISPDRLAELGISAESIADMIGSTHAAYCAEERGRVVGFSMGDLTAGSVFALFIHPEYEGKGLGKKLLEAVVEELGRAGHSKLVLSTEPGTRAYEFYTRQGWRHTRLLPNGEAELVFHPQD